MISDTGTAVDEPPTDDEVEEVYPGTSTKRTQGQDQTYFDYTYILNSYFTLHTTRTEITPCSPKYVAHSPVQCFKPFPKTVFLVEQHYSGGGVMLTIRNCQ